MQVSPGSFRQPSRGVFSLRGSRRLRFEQIRKQLFIDIAGEEARKLPPQPGGQVAREFILAVIEAMQDERAEQHLAPGVLGAFLFAQSCLEGLSLRFDLRQPFFNGFAGHIDILLSLSLRADEDALLHLAGSIQLELSGGLDEIAQAGKAEVSGIELRRLFRDVTADCAEVGPAAFI